MNSIGVIITVIFVVIWVVRGIASVMGQDPESRAEGQTGQKTDLDQRIAAQRARRARLAEQQGGQAQALAGRQSASPQDLSQMSMAERIELARQRARSGPVSQRGQNVDEAQAGMQQAMREKQELEARQRAQLERRRQAKEQAERRKALQSRQQRAEARKQAEQQRAKAEQLERRRRRTQRQARQTRKPGQPTRQSAQPAQAAGKSRTQQRQASKPAAIGTGPLGARSVPRPTRKRGAVHIGTLDANALRKAFIMKELLDKPVALRGEQDGLLS